MSLLLKIDAHVRQMCSQAFVRDYLYPLLKSETVITITLFFLIEGIDVLNTVCPVLKRYYFLLKYSSNASSVSSRHNMTTMSTNRVMDSSIS